MISIDEIKRIINDIEQEGTSLDYKEDLILDNKGDKAEFIKDVVSLANSGKISHIITGVQDKPKKLVGIKTHHETTQLNEILVDKCDPPISVEYIETKVSGYEVGIIEIHGENPPYIISVRDKLGGDKSKGEPCYIYRGTIYIRNIDKNEGASREHVEKMYESKIKYVTVQADVGLTHSCSVISGEEYKEVNIDFKLVNRGDILIDSPVVFISFRNIEQISKCKKFWRDISSLNPIPTVQFYANMPPAGRTDIGGITVRVKNDIKLINTHIEIYATNMKNKKFEYSIPINEE